MSERIPPTGTIRLAFAEAHPFPLTTEVDERLAEFDRWLAQYEQQLREQIAQEIEAAPKWTGVDSHDTWYLHGLRAAASIARKERE